MYTELPTLIYTYIKNIYVYICVYIICFCSLYLMYMVYFYRLCLWHLCLIYIPDFNGFRSFLAYKKTLSLDQRYKSVKFWVDITVNAARAIYGHSNGPKLSASVSGQEISFLLNADSIPINSKNLKLHSKCEKQHKHLIANRLALYTTCSIAYKSDHKLSFRLPRLGESETELAAI